MRLCFKHSHMYELNSVLIIIQDSGALVKQITQLFRDKEEVDAQLEKEKKARARSDQV